MTLRMDMDKKNGPSLPLQQGGRKTATIGAAAQSPSHSTYYISEPVVYKSFIRTVPIIVKTKGRNLFNSCLQKVRYVIYSSYFPNPYKSLGVALTGPCMVEFPLRSMSSSL